ncbi:MAG: tRNA (adenosine(37)-N6)-dimethylallyltransferase MiaA [Chitinophagaceae bacterium]|nr:tRNA (adenosine(37)-N6)-dimethylallyltransferase MiaA [Oligoflexus sp.]
MKKRYVAVIGPTASGKSDLAMKLAKHYNGELVNCDSVQIYRGFDIGSAKPTSDEQAEVPHHLIDILDWNEDFDARSFARVAEDAIAAIEARGRMPIVVGGTGLYLRALWQDGFHDLPKDVALRAELSTYPLERLRLELDRLDPKRSSEIHDNDRFRLQRALEVATLLGHSVKNLPPPESRQAECLVIAMPNDRTELQKRIKQRSRNMMEKGLIQEVEGLLAQGVSADCKPMQSIGYREVVMYLKGEIDRAQLEEAIIITTRQYAKRQNTLFRKVAHDLQWSAESAISDLNGW